MAYNVPAMKTFNRIAIATAMRGAWLGGGVLVAAVAAAWPQAGWAGGSPVARTEQTQLRLISTVDAVGNGTILTFGAHFRMIPGWKTYWRSPGDAGFPMTIDWRGSTNVARVEISWPQPTRFSVLGLTTLGYEGEVVFPLAVTLERPGQPVSLRVKIDYLTCAEICIPYSAELRLDLPQGAAQPAAEAILVAKYIERLPQRFEHERISLESAQIADGEKGPVLVVTVRGERGWRKPDLLVESADILAADPPRLSIEEDGRVARFAVTLVTDKKNAAALAGKDIVLTVSDPDNALFAEGKAAPRLAAAQAQGGWLEILAIALLGGLILNLMPCVLPVLSLKLLGALRHADAPAGRLRVSFVVTAAGIVVSFLLLAGLAVALRGAGLVVAQGIQFQQPAFLIVMIAVILLFAVNMAGRFEISLPGFLGGVAAGAPGGLGDGAHRYAGAFATGMLATLLATPCTAPFVGTALTFALTRGPGEIVAIFACLGLGLALPYLAVAAMPGVARLLPRPGRWMNGLKIVLALGLLGTALWLLWLLEAVAGGRAAFAVGALMLIGAALLWSARRMRAAAWSGAALALLAALLAPRLLPGAPVKAAVGLWRDFDRAAIARLVGEGKTVLVDVTADWCVTCQVNKKLVLDTEVVRARLGAANVVAMRADWTRPNDAIAAFLKSFDRYGIPFNVVFGPAHRDGLKLPELLTTASLLGGLDAAASGNAGK